MIDQEIRKAVIVLYDKGVSIRQISLQLEIDRKTVSNIIEKKGAMPDKIRGDKIEVDPELLRRLYNKCGGWKERIHEELAEHGQKIGYSTLTRLIRQLDIGQKKSERCSRVPDEPGAELQHDTSRYRLKIGDAWMWVVAALIYFRYCKQRYLKFYRYFTRFKMKCFLHESLTFYEYIAAKCIIDNTNLAVLRGSGKNAVMVPEMERFLKQYGDMVFEAHEINHSNRKAGNERGFWTVETNFFPGREFSSLEDLNRQAFEWATVKCANRPVGKSKLIPVQAFETEKPFLQKIPPYVPPPYQVHDRGTDQYGYAAFDGNYYWVPGKGRHDVRILEYDDRLKIFHNRKELIEYKLPPDGTKNEPIRPEGMEATLGQPKNRKKPTDKELRALRESSDVVAAYLEFALKAKGVSRHRFIRRLHGLYNKMTLSIFVKALERALAYEITDIRTIERMALIIMRDDGVSIPSPNIDEGFRDREAYQEGQFTDEPDFSVYDNLADGEDDEEGN